MKTNPSGLRRTVRRIPRKLTPEEEQERAEYAARCKAAAELRVKATTFLASIVDDAEAPQELRVTAAVALAKQYD